MWCYSPAQTEAAIEWRLKTPNDPKFSVHWNTSKEERGEREQKGQRDQIVSKICMHLKFLLF